MLEEDKTWFIDPRTEAAFGFMSALDLSQEQEGQTLLGRLESVFLLRGRIGSDLDTSQKEETMHITSLLI